MQYVDIHNLKQLKDLDDSQCSKANIIACLENEEPLIETSAKTSQEMFENMGYTLTFSRTDAEEVVYSKKVRNGLVDCIVLNSDGVFKTDQQCSSQFNWEELAACLVWKSGK